MTVETIETEWAMVTNPETGKREKRLVRKIRTTETVSQTASTKGSKHSDKR